MLVWRERLQSVPIMSLQTGARLGAITEPIIDPHDLQIAAFYCQGPMVDFKPAILHTTDIREYGELGVIINDSDTIMPLDDLVRLQKIISFRFTLIDMKVVDTTGTKLGKVNNYVVDTNTFQIVKFSVKRPMLASIQNSELIIDRQQIRKITDSEIVVASPTVKQNARNKAVPIMPTIDNPFRRQTPVENIKQFR